ncbi:gamma carbonic anhydrase family protein [Rathayibacter rathayi]|uniref:Gamma carbonic anhydrase family protein n=1 Tax=Rathayibacter rathayi TaxID=33887 RepID=A0ABX5AD38_RATRA|nr:gamma carbonic anhydrase family protein [Rathayibacter rathayi]AZZ48865.1 gamma carbonic anhydrase family protein [Rathayibacter rathayi]MWV73959.1 gamma carbonic anhydrase family protein [Rathayibacter rathayi NCPPB 2980 = VKM Ac-1601]PPF24766.1 gamma carbonic anhydrase family protein [Rathayibacter rathayi]PPF49533.1 gamma carbonic anhydrase family protein [Rathayibacter rathayi]PPF80250.1 gamma carbonic anhydrase family protein [Rathayibacter rathayi]
MSSTPAAGARVLTLPGGRTPEIAATAWIAPGATVVGSVRLGEQASLWYGAVLRAEHARIEVGARSNLQDGVVVHVDAGHDAVIGAGVSVGHNAVLHGCTIEDDVLVGMNATVLNGAVIGTGSLIAAGAVVLEGTRVPPGSLVAGVPAKVRRELSEQERAGIRHNAASYLALREEHVGAIS